jgi:hypothetical protein
MRTTGAGEHSARDTWDRAAQTIWAPRGDMSGAWHRAQEPFYERYLSVEMLGPTSNFDLARARAVAPP